MHTEYMRYKILRLLIFLWLPLWVGLPFIHVHPGVGHAHASPDHQHAPVFHSIFQEDLPDVLGSHRHGTHGPVPTLTGPIHPDWEHSHQELVHPALGFYSLSSSSDWPHADWKFFLLPQSNISSIPIPAIASPLVLRRYPVPRDVWLLSTSPRGPPPV